MATFSIRQAISSDIPALMALDHGYSTSHVWQMSLERSNQQIGATFREVRLPRPMRVVYPRDPQRLADEWTRRGALLIAETEETPLAYLALVQGPAEDMAWVTDLVVELVYRKRGIATQLVAAAQDWCQARALRRIMVEMQSKNYPGICLARKLGFVFAGYSDRYYPDEDIALFFSADL